MRKKLKRIAIGLIIVIIVVCAGVPAVLWGLGGGTPNIAVDYVALLNEKAAAVPEEDRAWPLYRDAAIGLARLNDDEDELLHEKDRADVDIDSLRSIVTKYGPELDLIRRGAAKPGMGFVTSDVQPDAFWMANGTESPDPAYSSIPSAPPPFTMDVLLPHLGESIVFTLLLRADAEVAMLDGDGERFVSDIVSMLRLAVHVEEHSLVLSHLISIYIRTIAFRSIIGLVTADNGVLDEAQLGALATAIASIFNGEDITVDLTSERQFSLDVIQRIYSDDGAGNGHITAAGLRSVGDLASDVMRSGTSPSKPEVFDRIMTGLLRCFSSDRKSITVMMDKYLDGEKPRLNIPKSEWRNPDIAEPNSVLERAKRFPPDIGAQLVLNFLPSLRMLFLGVEKINLNRNATECVIAISRWRAKHGEWPGSLDMLVGEYLDSVPLDPFDGQPLRYKVTDDGPILYSIGPDFEDDGGVPSNDRFDLSTDVDADWVFFGRRFGTTTAEESDTGSD